MSLSGERGVLMDTPWWLMYQVPQRKSSEWARWRGQWMPVFIYISVKPESIIYIVYLSLSTYLSLSVCPFIPPSSHPSIYLWFIYIYTHIDTYIYVYIYIYIYICIYVWRERESKGERGMWTTVSLYSFQKLTKHYDIVHTYISVLV